MRETEITVSIPKSLGSYYFTVIHTPRYLSDK